MLSGIEYTITAKKHDTWPEIIGHHSYYGAEYYVINIINHFRVWILRYMALLLQFVGLWVCKSLGRKRGRVLHFYISLRFNNLILYLIRRCFINVSKGISEILNLYTYVSIGFIGFKLSVFNKKEGKANLGLSSYQCLAWF